MNNIIKPSIFLLSTILAIPALATDGLSPIGIWLSDDKESKLEIFNCDEKLCGKIVWLKNDKKEDGSPVLDANNENEALRDRPIVGLDILTGLEKQSAKKWDDGEIYDPKSGKTYRAKIALKSADKMKLSGCINSFLCQGDNWYKSEL
ncbi:DUF2147 domain-containing protein [Pseudoteredinibacter isoporae]|uniref:Uncharacterized protein (DUF2147 family) n=1 Tax=Pseudoteredinibacter isoporae TaxID=570281 RepID=A0A7X0JV68_9GAMM|nr:DUF2147 domain-containing protein [Pseudoteredinibacter isoporae]MBB6521901.1 uncharacterized protein (DUF2147 family) [Pseudoteredinibacter isoporae]NHO87444.1 DUF2147 domain-containing protein [Pseudoteredinibacter isoporae]NIB24225.1 DUF2147 domain-containing protein [Pseudoteredinibacter isoporae]